MLQEEKASLGLEHAPHLTERRDRIRNRAERPRADDGVEARVGERQALGVELRLRHRKGRRGYPRGDPRRQRVLRVDDGEAGDRRRVVREVQAGSEPDLEHVAARLGEGAAALGRATLRPERQLHEAREDVPPVEAHEGLQSTRR